LENHDIQLPMDEKLTINIGTRGSKLALAQADIVSNLLKEHHQGVKTNIIKIKTTGDKILEKNLNEIGGKGLFIKEIEEHLLDGRVDIAVHSMKDMPALMHDAFEIPCILEREDARDALISKKCSKISDLPQGAVVGSSSPRRAAQILSARPDINIVQFRGNIHTRLQKLEDNIVDATLLAMAGLIRGNIQSDIIYPIDDKEMLPAVAQGAIGIQIRKDDSKFKDVLAPLNHETTYKCIMAERVFLKEFEGSCKTPIGALARIDGDNIKIEFMIASLDGSKVYRTVRQGAVSESTELATDAASYLKYKAGDGFFS